MLVFNDESGEIITDVKTAEDLVSEIITRRPDDWGIIQFFNGIKVVYLTGATLPFDGNLNFEIGRVSFDRTADLVDYFVSKPEEY